VNPDDTQKNSSLNWLFSITIGACVAILVLWSMSSLVDMQSFEVLQRKDSSSARLIGTRHLCYEALSDLDREIPKSNSCQTDDDCLLLMAHSSSFSQCSIAVQSAKKEIVSSKLRQARWHCGHRPFFSCRHSNAVAVCQNNICTVEPLNLMDDFRVISFRQLETQTMNSIVKNLNTNYEKGRN